MPLKTLHFILLCVLQTGWFCAFSQKLNLKFEHLDINNGLSQNHIMCILQDSRGFMWFGAHDGLNRFDKVKENFEGFVCKLCYRRQIWQNKYYREISYKVKEQIL